jgi:hypothetical protein
MHPGFAGVVQSSWPRPRGWTPPQYLDALDVQTLPGVGPTLAKRLRSFGIATVRDLLLHAPRRYESAVDTVAISKLGEADGEVAIEGRVVSARARPLRGRRTLVTAVVADGSGGQINASFFNQPWLAEKLTPGTPLRARGKLGRYGFDVKSYDLGKAKRTADHAPVYPASESIPSTRLRELVRAALAQYGGSFPDALPAELDLALRGDALGALHFPVDEAQAEEARRRLALDELVALQLVVARLRTTDAVAPSLAEPGELIARYREVLPFTLTEHQERAIMEIDLDLAQTTPMQRLLQGDGRRAVRAAARRRERAAGRADGADCDARGAALPHARAAVHAARRRRRAAHRRGEGERRRTDRRRHARAHPARRRLSRPRRRGRRRAAPLRRRAAAGAGRAALAARAAHDGDADPAHARADDLRRPIGERDREAARRPQADHHRARRRGALERRV